MPLGPDKIALLNRIQVAITTKVALNSVSPTDVGGSDEDIVNTAWPYLEAINRFGIWDGTVDPNTLPAFGASTDLYFQESSGEFSIWRKDDLGVWNLLITVSTSPLIGSGPLTVRDFISGFTVTVTAGTWAIDNTIYRKLTQTVLTVDPADLNFTRYDLIKADDTGAITYVAGVASSTPAFPVVPADAIAVDYVIVPSISSGFEPYLLYNDSSGSAPGSTQAQQITVPCSTPIVINWLTDLVPSGGMTWAQRFGNFLPSFRAEVNIGGDDWGPSAVTVVASRPAGVLTTVTLSDIAAGIITVS